MNSFQRWADEYARAHGFDVTHCGNWVTLHRDGTSQNVMTVGGVLDICRALQD